MGVHVRRGSNSWGVDAQNRTATTQASGEPGHAHLLRPKSNCDHVMRFFWQDAGFFFGKTQVKVSPWAVCLLLLAVRREDIIHDLRRAGTGVL